MDAAGCRCILCCCRCIHAASLPRDLDHSCSRLQMHFMLLQMHPRCIPSLRSGSQLQQAADAFYVAADASQLHPYSRDLDNICSRLQMHFMLLQMHPRCIPSPWSGSQLQPTADAFYVVANASTLHPFPVIWISAAADYRCIFFSAVDASTLHPFPSDLDHNCSRLQMHFMLLQMHPRCIPSQWRGSQLQQATDAFFYCCRCIQAASLPPDLDHSCSRLQMHFMMVQMHQRCIPSPWAG